MTRADRKAPGGQIDRPGCRAYFNGLTVTVLQVLVLLPSWEGSTTVLFGSTVALPVKSPRLKKNAVTETVLISPGDSGGIDAEGPEVPEPVGSHFTVVPLDGNVPKFLTVMDA